MVRYVHPGEELAVQIKQGIRAADVANTASGTEKARTRDSTIIGLLDEFAVTLSPTVEPSSGWSSVAPPWVAGEYVWKRTTTTYGDGATAVGPALLATGNDGEPGAPGANGADGRGIASTTITYQAGVSGTTAPTGTWSSTVPSVPAGQFLWTRTIFTYTSGTPATTTEYSVGRMGDDGADGRGVTGAVTTYQASASGTAVPSGAWLTNPPTVTAGSFLWSRTVTSYTSGADTNAYSVAQQGATGAPGTAGVSVSSSTMFYWLGTTQPAAPTVLTPPAPWSSTEPTYTPGTSSNLYVVVRTVLSSGTFSYSVVSMSASFAAAKSAFGKYTFSDAAPVVADGGGKPVGAMWVRKSVAGEINGYWEWSGSAWQARPLSQEIIPLIMADMISVGALDGYTITGGLIRTAASGQRMQFDASGLRAFNASEVVTAALAAATGGLVLIGSITTTAGGNERRAIMSDGGISLDLPGSPGAGITKLTPSGVEIIGGDAQRGLYRSGGSGGLVVLDEGGGPSGIRLWSKRGKITATYGDDERPSFTPVVAKYSASTTIAQGNPNPNIGALTAVSDARQSVFATGASSPFTLGTNQITIKEDGAYQFSLNAIIPGFATTGRTFIQFGGALAQRIAIPVGEDQFGGFTFGQMLAGDVITFAVFQTSGGARTVTTTVTASYLGPKT